MAGNHGVEHNSLLGRTDKANTFLPRRLATLFSHRALLGRLALSGGSILITVLVFEVGMRIVAPQDLDFYNGEKIMRRSTRPGQLVEFIPNSVNNSYIGVPVRINSTGLRDRELALPKPEGVFRVLAVGNSVTFGFGVRLEETYVKRLERRLNASLEGSTAKAEVINAGIEGTGIDYYFHFLRTTGALLAPDLVLVGIVLNDISDYDGADQGQNPHRSAGVSVVTKLNRTIRSHSHLYFYGYSALKSILYKTGALDINQRYANNFLTLGPPSEPQSRAWKSSLAHLAELVELGRSLKIPIVLVVFPMEMQLSAEARDLYRRALGVKLDDNAVSGEPQRRLAELARIQYVPLIDLLPRFRGHRGGSLFLRNRVISHDWAHPSPEGHDVAADEIFRALRQLELVPASPKPGERRILRKP